MILDQQQPARYEDPGTLRNKASRVRKVVRRDAASYQIKGRALEWQGLRIRRLKAHVLNPLFTDKGSGLFQHSGRDIRRHHAGNMRREPERSVSPSGRHV